MQKERYSMKLQKKIEDRSATVNVVGLGYVGLPLALEAARAGYRVNGIDLSQEKRELLAANRSYVDDITSREIAECRENEAFNATCDFSVVGRESDISIICVPTPLDKFKQPDLSYVESATKSIAAHLHKGSLVVLESTTYPGTTQDIIAPLLEAGSGLKAGVDFHLAFSPERVDPGNLRFRTKNTPKVVGGYTPQCAALTEAFYSSILDAPICLVASTKEAEACKILENTFRVVNCALANEMAVLFHRMDIDLWDVIRAASTKPFGFMPFYPGPGVGGHCIPLDPFYLTYKAKQYNMHIRLIDLAGEVNDAMPSYIIQRAMFILNERGKALRGSNVMISGVTYKGDVSDTRESPSLELMQMLLENGAHVSFHDPWCPELSVAGRNFKSQDLNPDLLASLDLIIVASGHKTKVNYRAMVDSGVPIFDTRNAVAPALGAPAGSLKNLIRL